MRAREVADAHMVETALTPRAEQSLARTEGAGWLVNLSFLMRREDAAAFLEAADRLGADHPHLELLVNGPLPPYSFVRPLESAAAE
ncbi:GvpL/GvpF family gas vesicle protein OS=Streptomyces rimosus subsp. rimosus (strain ATCC / DSM 40260 / JCM 4667 / NRRL 2234) OX=1265868 GN=SRIM_008540 PE=3 SV=1 [Streptomyces rimosus subsp. rimosus]